MLPLASMADLDPLLDAVGDARLVLLGEAAHGTSEYYRWRTALTQRLVEEKGFRFVAVEGDWPDCQRVDRYVRGQGSPHGSAREVLATFDRWPTWMWANEEAEELVAWMRGHAEGHPRAPVAFHGLDVYSLWGSLRAVVRYADARLDGEAQEAARRAWRCFQPYGEDAQAYAAATRWVPSSCEAEVTGMLRGLRARLPEGGGDALADLEAAQNAEVVRNAERYYRAMVRGGPGSWNLRDTHMMDTLDRLLAHHGPGAKGVVWAHNTHVGDASATDMADAGMTNLGQLARERHGRDDVFVVGFGSYEGTVVAGKEWDAPWERMQVPPAREGSLEETLHEASGGRDVLLFPPRDARWRRPVPHRAIGVVYDPRGDRWGNYVRTVLADRYDAFLFLDRTRALAPLGVAPRREEADETYPTGF